MTPVIAPAEPEVLDSLQLAGRSLRDWHSWLVEAERKEPGYSIARGPCDALAQEERAWVAIALELIYVNAYGEDWNVEGALNHYQGLVANNSPEVKDLVRDYGYSLPEALKPLIAGW